MCIAIVGDVSNVILDTTTTPVIIPTKYQEELYFASRFFDSYFHSQLNNEFNSYYILMGAVTYYFANMNGSAKVMLNHLSDSERFDFLASGLEKVIIWLLDSNQTFDFNEIDYRYREYVHLKKIKT